MDNNLAASCMKLISCFMTPYVETEIKIINQEQLDFLGSMVKEIFFFSMTWSIGCTTNLAGREKFDKWIRERIIKSQTPFPEDKLVYDYVWTVDTKEWKSWHETIKEYVVDVKAPYSEIVVPTLDSIRMKWLMRTLLNANKNVMIPGPTGTGKSVYVTELMI
jgi:dynein heavy chain